MKKTSITIIIILITFMTPGTTTFENKAYATDSITIDSRTQTISPQSDIIEWRYKVENGKLYKRLYNCTESKWIGNWILVI